MVNEKNLQWTENRLSDTVVEFKATIQKKRNIINEFIIGNNDMFLLQYVL